MQKAGLSNLAARLSTDRMGQLTLEEIVRADPDLLIVNAENNAPPSIADGLLRHPVLAAFAASGRSVAVPPRLWTCAGPALPEAAARLAAAWLRLSGAGASGEDRPAAYIGGGALR